MGWSPVTRSMIDSLRCAKPTWSAGCFQIAWPSGPRWACTSFITSRRRPRSGIGCLERSIAPAIPHTARLAYRIGPPIWSGDRERGFQRALEGGRVVAPDPGQQREVLEPAKADSHLGGGVIELYLAPQRAMVPLDGLQLSPM